MQAGSFISVILCSCMSLSLLCACSISDETDEEIKNQVKETQIEVSPLVKAFIDDANTCVKGDIENLPSIIARYRQSYRDKNYAEPLSLQQKIPNRAFEKCAQKALRLGDDSAFKAIVTRPAQATNISRRFYLQNNLQEGAFWLQRVINLEGPLNGYERVGLNFIKHKETLPIGAKLLEYAARLGSITARQSLYNLTVPSSFAFQQLTGANDGNNENTTEVSADALQHNDEIPSQDSP